MLSIVMKLEYTISWGQLTAHSNVYMLDGYIKELLEMGAKPEDIKITFKII